MSAPEPSASANRPPTVVESLREAISREADISASFTTAGSAAKSPGGVSTPSVGRIVELSPDSVTLQLSPPPPLDPADAHRAWTTVAIRTASHELVFFAAVRSLTPGQPGQPTTLVAQLPSEVIATRRRRSFRSPAATGDEIGLKLWRIGEYAFLTDQPKASQSFVCELCDLSIDGIGAVLHARKVEAMRLVAGQRFRVELSSPDAAMLFEARLIHPKASARDDESVRCGFSFVARDNDIEYRRNRQKLDAVLAKLQQRAAAAARKSA